MIKFWLLIRTLMDYLFKSSLSLGGATSGTDNVCLPRLYPLVKEAVKTKELSPPSPAQVQRTPKCFAQALRPPLHALTVSSVPHRMTSSLAL